MYVGNNTVYALDATDGREQWQVATKASVDAPVSVVDGTVYAGMGAYGYAFDAGDGTRRWRFLDRIGQISSPAVVDGLVYVGNGAGFVHAIGEP